ncbi:MAG TPA: limonene-1,2-epoxide hydrolase family protein [Mycobacterium sp.]
MPDSAGEIVTEFCALWADPDPGRLAGYFTENGVYHNIPMAAVQGRAAIEEFISGFTAMCDGIDFIVHRQVADGDLVFNERTDVMRLKNGKTVELPVTGVFEIRDGRIAAWRDYFDMAAVTAAFS